jgi:hypothetical protein
MPDAHDAQGRRSRQLRPTLEVNMLRIRSSLIVSVAIIVLAALHPTPAQADTWDQLTYLTFSAPVEVPGTVLPAGTYTFKLADADNSRNVVRVLSRDGSKVYATFFTIPDERLTPTDKPAVTFEETPAGTPEAIKAWFYPGDAVGHEFVYPNDQAQKIAAATHQHVLASASVNTNMPSSTSGSSPFVASIKNAPVTRIDEHGATQPMHSDRSARTAPMKSLQAASSSTTAPTDATNRAPKSTHTSGSTKELPQTASPLPLVALLGLTSLTLAIGARAFRKRLA